MATKAETVRADCQCEYCGQPLEQGDRAIIVDNDWIYCSRDCANDAKPYRARELAFCDHIAAQFAAAAEL